MQVTRQRPSELRTVPSPRRAFVCVKKVRNPLPRPTTRRVDHRSFKRSVRCLLKKGPPGGRCRQPAGTHFGVLTGSGASPAPKAGLITPQMPDREGLAGRQGAKWPAQSLAPKRACCVPWRGWEPSPGGLGAWSRINIGCSESRPLRARPDQHIVQSGTHG